MSSLGFQTIYRELNALPDVTAERAFLPDDVAPARQHARGAAHLRVGAPDRRLPGRGVLAGLRAGDRRARRLPRSGRHPRLLGDGARQATPGPSHPLVVIGGPLTFSNPVPAGALRRRDPARRGGGDWWPSSATAIREERHRAPPCWPTWRDGPGFYVPAIHGEKLPPIAAAADELPARPLADPHAAHRARQHVPHRAGARLPPRLHLLRDAPVDQRRHAPRGARTRAVADSRGRARGWASSARPSPITRGCPRSCARIVDGGREVGISSLRADRLNDEIVGLLKRGGYRTLTTAADGASERMRDEHPAQDQRAAPDARGASCAARMGSSS